jgi:hypothetical protein
MACAPLIAGHDHARTVDQSARTTDNDPLTRLNAGSGHDPTVGVSSLNMLLY